MLILLIYFQLGGQKNALAGIAGQLRVVFPEVVVVEQAVEHKRWPSKPLSNASLAVVLKAGLINISHVDASHGHKKHPHRGARDENLTWGFVYDVTRIRRNAPAFNLSGAELAEACRKRDANYEALQRISVDVETHHEKTERAGNRRRARILCGVYSSAAYYHKIPAIRETWGQKCDGFFVASNKTDASIDAVDVPHAGESSFVAEFVPYLLRNSFNFKIKRRRGL